MKRLAASGLATKRTRRGNQRTYRILVHRLIGVPPSRPTSRTATSGPIRAR
jgi:hypothetical protein